MTETVEARFKAAVKDLKSAGVHVALNKGACCRGCTLPQHLGLTEESEPTTPYVWYFGGQGRRFQWKSGKAYYASAVRRVARRRSPRRMGGGLTSRDEIDTLWLNHGGPDLIAATKAKEIFEAHGFEVEWKGTEFDSVGVQVSQPS